MSETSDRTLLDLIRRSGPLTVIEMSANLRVTGTVIRVRLARLLAAGSVERRDLHQGRGPGIHQVSVEAQKRLGQNYSDLAVALWEELMGSIEDRKLRRLMFLRVTDRLARDLPIQVTGHEWEGG